MSLSLVRARIKGVIDGVAGVGATHDYIRFAAVQADVEAQFKSSGILHTWFVALAKDRPYIVRRFPSNFEIADYQFELLGFYALQDSTATEKTFADEVEAVIEAFRADKKLGDTVIEAGPAQWLESDHRSFASTLCHHARLGLMVREQVEP